MVGDKALETTSIGLDDLERLVSRTKFNEKDLVDLSAKVHATYSRLQKMDKEIVERCKAEMLQRDVTILQGSFYQASLSRFTKQYLMTDKVKSFLGKNLPKFMDTREETQIKFGVKA